MCHGRVLQENSTVTMSYGRVSSSLDVPDMTETNFTATRLVGSGLDVIKRWEEGKDSAGNSLSDTLNDMIGRRSIARKDRKTSSISSYQRAWNRS